MSSNIIKNAISKVFDDLSSHPEVTLHDLAWVYRFCPWNRYKLTHRPDFTLEWVWILVEDDTYLTDWDWDFICQHLDMTTEWLDGIFEDKLNFTLLSKHPNFTYHWMNLYIGAPWDLDYILQRPDFKDEDLLKVFLKPTQQWNDKLLRKKFGNDWYRCYKIADFNDPYFRYVNNLEEVFLQDKNQCKRTIKKWFDASVHRIVDHRNEGWNDSDDDDDFYLCGYFATHKYFGAKEFEKTWRHYHLKKELAPIAWHPDRYWDWCMSEDEKNEISKLWS
jgi:hypothetical protein